MKKNVYSLAVITAMLFLTGAAIFAQTNITPAKFKFSEMPAGSKNIFDESLSGANPPANYVPANKKNGYAIIGGAPAYFPGGGQAIINNMSVVTDPQLGNVLMFKGKNSKETLGVNNPQTVGGFWSMNFYGSNETPAATNIRVSVIMKCIAETSFGANDAIKLSITSFSNNGLVSEKEAIYLMDEGWWIFETDFMVPETTGCPPRFKFAIDGGKADNIAFYMTDIKLTANPVGTPIIDQYNPPVSTEKTNSELIRIYANDGRVFIQGQEDAPVNIYTVAGNKIHSAIKTGNNYDVALAKGLYIVEVGKKVVKVVI